MDTHAARAVGLLVLWGSVGNLAEASQADLVDLAGAGPGAARWSDENRTTETSKASTEGVDAPDAAISSGESAPARPSPKPLPLAERVATWLGAQLRLSSEQGHAVRAVVERDLSGQAAALAKGLTIQTAPPPLEELFTPEDTQPLSPEQSRGQRAAVLLNDAERRKRAAKWLADRAKRTPMAPELLGLRLSLIHI